MGPSFPNQFRYQLFSIFKEQCTESIKFLGVLRQTPRQFAENEIKPYVLEFEKLPKEEIPWNVMRKAMSMGILSSYVPKKYGGTLSGLSSVIFLEEISAASGSIAILISGTGLGFAPIAIARNKDQMDRFFIPIVEAEKRNELCYWSYALTEPDSGSDAEITDAAKKTRLGTYAKREGDHYVINGRKCFITMGHMALSITIYF